MNPDGLAKFIVHAYSKSKRVSLVLGGAIVTVYTDRSAPTLQLSKSYKHDSELSEYHKQSMDEGSAKVLFSEDCSDNDLILWSVDIAIDTNSKYYKTEGEPFFINARSVDAITYGGINQ